MKILYSEFSSQRNRQSILIFREERLTFPAVKTNKFARWEFGGTFQNVISKFIQERPGYLKNLNFSINLCPGFRNANNKIVIFKLRVFNFNLFISDYSCVNIQKIIKRAVLNYLIKDRLYKNIYS